MPRTLPPEVYNPPARPNPIASIFNLILKNPFKIALMLYLGYVLFNNPNPSCNVTDPGKLPGADIVNDAGQGAAGIVEDFVK